MDESDTATEDGEPEWTDLGEWREASLWMARQLLALGSPVMMGTMGAEAVEGPDDGSRPFEVTGSPSRAARDLSDAEVLRMLSDPDLIPPPLPD